MIHRIITVPNGSSFRLLDLHGKLPHGKVRAVLFLLLCHPLRILRTQPPSDSSCLFRSEVQWQILLLRVVLSEGVSLVGVDHCEDTGYRFAEVVSESLSVCGLQVVVSGY